MIGLIVVGKPAATVITSLPGLSFNAERANRLAEEPELTTSVYLTPKYLLNRSWNNLEYLPSVHQPSNAASTILMSSFSSYRLPETGTLKDCFAG